LQNNGGPTFTANLLPSSIAIAHGDPTNSPSNDQRGFKRPGQGETQPSIGAFEYQKPAASLGTNANAIYVENLYETLLGRTADAGAAGWVSILNGGGTASSVVQGIEASNEYLTDLVGSLYAHYLHRALDPGAQGWVNILASGGTIEQVIQGLVSSAEFFALHGSTNSAYVDALYGSILNRTGSNAEVQAWVNLLNSGTSRASVAGSFLSSQEYRTGLVESYYKQFLGRVADAAGLAAWVAQLNAGVHDQVVLASILGSTEAFGKRS
jgi:hypothetical protein